MLFGEQQRVSVLTSRMCEKSALISRAHINSAQVRCVQLDIHSGRRCCPVRKSSWPKRSSPGCSWTAFCTDEGRPGRCRSATHVKNKQLVESCPLRGMWRPNRFENLSGCKKSRVDESVSEWDSGFANGEDVRVKKIIWPLELRGCC